VHGDQAWAVEFCFPIGNVVLKIPAKSKKIPDRETICLEPHAWNIISRTGNTAAMASIRSSQQLGVAIRAARKQLALTQPQLALAAGVGVRFIVDLEGGKPTVRLEQVLRVIEALGGEISLTGLPAAAAQDPREGHGDGA